MRAYQIKVIEDVTEEPVTLAEIKAWLRIDADYSANDASLLLTASAAREKLEQHLNIGFAPRTLEVQFSGGVHKLPYSPTISENSEIVVKDIEGDEIDAENYHITGFTEKSIALGCGSSTEFFYPRNGGTPEVWVHSETQTMYNVIYETGYETLPSLLKQALLTQIDYDFKAEGSEQLEPLSPVALQKASGYSKNLVIQ